MASSNSSRPRAPRALFIALVLGSILVAAGCTSKARDMVGGGGGGGGNPPAATIDIVANAATKGMLAFSPDTVTVHVNGVVRMHNGDSITHQIDFNPTAAAVPDWGDITAGQSVDTTPTAAGTYTYVCAIPGHVMIGRLIVLP